MSAQLRSLARRAVAPVGVFVTAIAVYLRTMMPYVGFWDTGEYQAVPYLLGIMHNTGYPTYTLIGKLFSFLPVGSVAYRMSLMSGVCAALAATLVTLLARRLGVRDAVAVGAGLLFAFNQNFWNVAGKADSHTMHAAFALGALALVLRWRDDRRPRTLAFAGLVAALGLGNHMLMAMALPGLAVLALAGRWREALAPRTIARWAGAGLAGLAVYLYLPVRARMHPPMNYGQPVDWPRFHELVFASHMSMSDTLLSRTALEHFLVLVPRLPEQFVPVFTRPGLTCLGLAAALGVVALVRRNHQVALGLALFAFPTFWVALLYPNGDSTRYYFVPMAMALLFAAVGAQSLVTALWRLGATRPPLRLAARALAAVAAALPLALVPLGWQVVDHSGDRAAEVLVADVLEELAPGAAVVCEWNEATPFWYKHYVEGLRPDLEVVYETNATAAPHSTLEAGIAARLRRRPVYVLLEPSRLQEVETRFELTPIERYPKSYLSLERVDGLQD